MMYKKFELITGVALKEQVKCLVKLTFTEQNN